MEDANKHEVRKTSLIILTNLKKIKLHFLFLFQRFNVSKFNKVLESRLKNSEVVWNEDGQILQVQKKFPGRKFFMQQLVNYGFKNKVILHSVPHNECPCSAFIFYAHPTFHKGSMEMLELKNSGKNFCFNS